MGLTYFPYQSSSSPTSVGTRPSAHWLEVQDSALPNWTEAPKHTESSTAPDKGKAELDTIIIHPKKQICSHEQWAWTKIRSRGRQNHPRWREAHGARAMLHVFGHRMLQFLAIT